MSSPLGAGQTVLAGDVGGTKTVLAVFDAAGACLTQGRYHSAAYTDLETMARDFLAAHPDLHPVRGCVGVAGPVENDRAQVTNLPWTIDGRAVAGALGLQRVRVINDFVAVAESIPHLAAEDLVALNAGSPEPEGNIGVLGAGTGLGEALLVRTHGVYQVLASEGGHADFAPRDDREAGLWAFLRRRFAHVSYERVLSGPGLVACFEFLCEHRGRPVPEAVRTRLSSEDAPAVVSGLGLAGEDPIAVEALDLFVSIYGAEAGNLALKILATGGIFLAGGIAAKILAVMRGGAFVRAFTEKGRFQRFCARVPVQVIVNELAGLHGAAAVALRL